MWVSIYLKRPNDAKTTKKIIKIFLDGYDEKDPYNLMVKESNHDNMCTMFYTSYTAIKKLNEYSSQYSNESFFEHAKYFLMFILSQIYDFNFENLDTDHFDTAIDKIKNCIEIEKNRNLDKGTEYSHNNYFKSSRPISDYNPNILHKLASNLEELLNEFNR